MKCTVYSPNREPKEYDAPFVAEKLAKELIDKKIYRAQYIRRITTKTNYQTGGDTVTVDYGNGWKTVYETK